MWPTIISIGPLAIQSFGLMMVLGIFFGGFLFWQKGREEGFEEESLMDVWLLSGLASLLFGRVWYIFSNWEVFSADIYKMLFITKYRGLSYEGVFVGAFALLMFSSLKRKWDSFRLLEVSVFAWLAVEMFGWFGSFLAGSNLGKVTSLFWGIKFPGAEGKRHPVQLIYIVCFWLLFKLFKKWEKEYRSFSWYKSDKGETKTGFLVGVYLVSMSLVKLVSSLVMDLSNLSAYYWFFSAMFVLGSLILIFRSGIYLKVLKKKEELKPKPKFESKKIKRKKKGFDFK